MPTFYTGQRWISESEPELGLGSIVGVTDRTVRVSFLAAKETREYAHRNSPLRRVRFRPGETIRNRKGQALKIQSIVEREGLLFYGSSRGEICEIDISDTMSFNEPHERMLGGRVDPPRSFELRMAALAHQHRLRKSKVRGFVGGRIDLIPHQLYIAHEVAGRLLPRVLLADEVGLGKTIEACLILHRLTLTGRAERVLVLVPESLVHQWFVELLRRFNLWFHIFDEERCTSIEEINPGTNPFLDDQFVLCSMSLFINNPARVDQVSQAGWDVLVVDEAHHLGWSPERTSPEYDLIAELGRKTPGLLLLTATPEQLGMSSHFARLRLLDPDRFFDLNSFLEEAEQYRETAREAEGTIDRTALEELLDQHGTGRVMFRNTRLTVAGFPERKAWMEPLTTPVATEFHAAKIDWLLDLVRELDPQKILLICRTQAKVVAIETAIRQRMNLTAAIFHEGLSLIQRDRNAAWFAEPNGARLLICSEIGSEGRNFQFAHHLVLFDLPPDPELLEQRIGRLDRIGQKAAIQVYVPFVTGTSQEVFARWFHEGLNAFEKNLHGGAELMNRLGQRVLELAHRFDQSADPPIHELDAFIEETKSARDEIATRLHDGRDRLLELSSFRPDVAKSVTREIRDQDEDMSLDSFMLSVFDHYSLSVEELAHRTYKLGSAGVLADSFPGLPADGFTVTCDRRRALAREDIQFLTWDHPLVTGALDFLLGSEQGNSSFAMWPDTRAAGLYMEAVYVLECVAPPALHADRFLPPTPLRVLVDAKGKQLPDIPASLKSGDASRLLEMEEVRDRLLPRLIETTKTIATTRVPEIVALARQEMTTQLNHEIARLTELKKVNRSVRQEEIDLLVEQNRALDGYLVSSRLRLDSVRLIQRSKA